MLLGGAGGGESRLTSERTSAGAALLRRSVTGRRRRDPERIDARANPDTDDSLGVAGKSQSKETAAGGVKKKKKEKIAGLDIFIAVRFDLKSARVYKSLLF